MHRFRTRKANRAFTLVELLVVVLILAILMAVALPLYLGAIRNSEKGAARANMQTIANANQSYKLQSGNYAPTNTDLNLPASPLAGDLGPSGIRGPGTRTYLFVTEAECDSDGNGDTKAVPNGGFAVKSTVGTDGCFIPGVSAR